MTKHYYVDDRYRLIPSRKALTSREEHINKCHIYLGEFDTEKDAERVYFQRFGELQPSPEYWEDYECLK